MKEITLVAGLDGTSAPGLARAAVGAGRSVLAAADTEKTEENAGQDISTFEWNRSSPLSARTLVLHTENMAGRITEAVVVFDMVREDAAYREFSSENCTRAVDELIAGYMFLTAELLGRFMKRNQGRLIFVLKECATAAEAVLTPSLKNRQDSMPVGIFTAVAAAAFRAFAENTAAAYLDKEDLCCLLVSVDASIDNHSLGSWLFSYIDEFAGGKVRRSPKQIVQWVKYGSRPISGFQFFKR